MKSWIKSSVIIGILASLFCLSSASAHPNRQHTTAPQEEFAASTGIATQITTQPVSAEPNQSSDPHILVITVKEAPSQQEEKLCAGMPCVDLVPLVDDVYFTVTESRNTVEQQAIKWGIPSNVITILNPGLKLNTVLTPGQKLLVEARMVTEPVPYSSGKSNRGRIRNARLMPEGEGYYLRDIRTSSWGTDTTIQSLMTAFHLYAEKYPDGPDINLGDISRRRGGKLSPHKSHQSGRDVDVGFVHTPEATEKSRKHFTRAASDNLDAEKTWFFIKSLLQTGNVQQVFVDTSVQKLLWNVAKDEITPEQRDLIFSWPHRSTSSSAIFQFWPGHRNHFHVRFKCPPNQPGCKK